MMERRKGREKILVEGVGESSRKKGKEYGKGKRVKEEEVTNDQRKERRVKKKGEKRRMGKGDRRDEGKLA